MTWTWKSFGFTQSKNIWSIEDSGLALGVTVSWLVTCPRCLHPMSAGGRQGTKSRRTLIWILSTKTLFSSILDLQVSIGFINEQLIGPRRHHGLMYVVYGAWTECWLSYSTLNYRPEWIELNYETISTSTLSICSLWESWWRIFFNISLASFFLRV